MSNQTLKNQNDLPFRLWKKRGLYLAVFPDRPRTGISTGVFVDESDGFPFGRSAAISWAWAYLDKSVPESGITLAEFAADFFIPSRCLWCKRKERKGKVYSEIYYKTHRGRLEKHILPRWGSVPLKNITVKGLDNWLLTYEKPNGSPWSPALLEKLLYCFRHILEEATYQELIPSNPAAKIDNFSTDKRREVFTSEEIKKLFPDNYDQAIEIWGDLRWYVFFMLMYSGGLRPGEVAAFHLSDWRRDLKGALISRAIESGTKNIKGLKTDKKGLSCKPVSFPEKLEDLLTVYAMQVKDPDDLAFRTNDGQVITTDKSGNHFRGALNRAGIERRGRVQYCLRHTFYTELLRKLPEDSVQLLAGHKSLRAEYDHRNAEDLLKGADSETIRRAVSGLF